MTGRQETAGDDQDTHMGRGVQDVRTQDTERHTQSTSRHAVRDMCAAHYHLLKTNLCFYELLQWSAFPSFFLSFRCFLVSCEQGSNSDWVRSQSWAGVAKQRNGTSIDSLSPNHPLTLPLNPAPVCVRVRCQPKRSYTQFSASLSGREKEQRLLQQNSHSFPVLNRSLRIAVAVVA